MGIQIEDGTGSGIQAEVTDENRLRVVASAGSLTNHVSVTDGNVFTVIGTATVVSGTTVVLHIINNDQAQILVIDRIVVQATNMGGVPTSGTYFSLGYGRTVTSGGTSVTPVNLNRTATKVANVTVTSSNPNVTGTFAESHRWLIESNGIAFELLAPRINDTVLGRSNTVEVQLVSNTSGNALTILKFMMTNPEEMA